MPVKNRNDLEAEIDALFRMALAEFTAARNALAASYVNFEQQRIQLLLDLEALQLDDRGFPYELQRTASLGPPLPTPRNPPP